MSHDQAPSFSPASDECVHRGVQFRNHNWLLIYGNSVFYFFKKDRFSLVFYVSHTREGTLFILCVTSSPASLRFKLTRISLSFCDLPL